MSVGIVTVTPGSPADRAGILPGERIDSIDGEPVLDEIDYMTADEAMQLVHSGDSIYIQGSTSIPLVLEEALARRGHELKGVTIYSAFNVGRGEAPFCKPEYKDAF